MTETQKTVAGIAVVSLVLGILGMLCLGPLCSIPAIICGHIAMSRIKKDRAALSGDGMALAGLIMGYLQIAFMVVLVPLMAAIAIPSFAKARDVAQSAVCHNNMRQIDAAKEMAAPEHGHEDGDTIPDEQVSEYVKGGLSSLICPKEGNYTINPLGKEPECSVHGSLSDDPMAWASESKE